MTDQLGSAYARAAEWMRGKPAVTSASESMRAAVHGLLTATAVCAQIRYQRMDVATCDALLFSNGSRAEALAAIEATCREAGGSPWLERRFNVFRGCGQRVQDELMLLLAAVVMEKPTTDFMLHAG